jgi:hypothetical protein
MGNCGTQSYGTKKQSTGAGYRRSRRDTDNGPVKIAFTSAGPPEDIQLAVFWFER